MTEFEGLKAFYASYIRFGLENNVACTYAKLGNNIFHKYCEVLVENSNYQDSEKMAMKQELEILKNALDGEIDTYFQRS